MVFNKDLFNIDLDKAKVNELLTGESGGIKKYYKKLSLDAITWLLVGMPDGKLLDFNIIKNRKDKVSLDQQETKNLLSFFDSVRRNQKTDLLFPKVKNISDFLVIVQNYPNSKVPIGFLIEILSEINENWSFAFRALILGVGKPTIDKYYLVDKLKSCKPGKEHEYLDYRRIKLYEAIQYNTNIKER